jgi:hypothetical protein
LFKFIITITKPSTLGEREKIMASSGWEAANILETSSVDSDYHQVENTDQIRVEQLRQTEGDDGGRHISVLGTDSNAAPRTAGKSQRQNAAQQIVRSETSEAAVARLTSAYGTALQCISAIRRLDCAIATSSINVCTNGSRDKKGAGQTFSTGTAAANATDSAKVIDSDDSKLVVDKSLSLQPDTPSTKFSANTPEEAKRSSCAAPSKHILESKMKKLAKTARSVLEDSFFADPSVAPYIPTLGDEFTALSFRESPRAKHSGIFLSSTQRKTLSKLTYLSLTNYADLLSSCACPTCRTSLERRKHTHSDILDRGVAKRLKSMTCCIWTDDIIQEDSEATNNNVNSDTRDEGLGKACEIANQDSKMNDRSNIEAVAKNSLITRLKFIVSAFVDSAELDPNDPTLWIKLACAARALSHVEPAAFATSYVQKFKGGEVQHPLLRDYSSIEKMAVERGLALFAPSLNLDLQPLPAKISGPPNRLLLRALDSLLHKDETDVFSRPRIVSSVVHSLSIHLPRYSWNSLGRSLMRACRDVSSFPSTITYYGPDDDSDGVGKLIVLHQETLSDASFPSPNVVIAVSPLLAYMTIPLLSKVCSFLSEGQAINSDIQNLEVTCRSMSSAILAASTITENRHRGASAQGLDSPVKTPPRAIGDTTKDAEGNKGEESALQSPIKEGAPMELEASQESSVGPMILPPPPPASPSRVRRASSRSSSRVRSQRLSQDRESEKSNKRSSAEYCLKACIFGCKMEHPIYRVYSASHRPATSLIRGSSVASTTGTATDVEQVQKGNTPQAALDWQAFLPLQGAQDILQSMHAFQRGKRDRHRRDLMLKRSALSLLSRQTYSQTQLISRIGDSSLNGFIRRYSGMNSGPMCTLRHFVQHVSSNVSAVFSGEEDLVLLSSCVMDCFEVLFSHSSIARSTFVPFWVGDWEPSAIVEHLTDPQQATDQNTAAQFYPCFSMNLLIAELKLRRCERQPHEITDIDADAAAVSYYVPVLLKISKVWNARQGTSQDQWWIELQARLHWLASAYCRWCGRTCQDASEASELEQVAIKHIEKCVEWLSMPEANPIGSVHTPHLESPSRTGTHWARLTKEPLLAYKDEIQAASIVNHARFRFQQITNKGESTEPVVETSTIKEQLEEIGHDLMKRYDVEYDGLGGKHEEIVLEFLSTPKIKSLLREANKSLSKEPEGCITTSSRDDEKACISREAVVKKWGPELWNMLPAHLPVSASKEDIEQGHVSVLTLLGICFSRSETLILPFLKLLIKLALCVFDQRSKIISDDRSLTRHRSESSVLDKHEDHEVASSDDDAERESDGIHSNSEHGGHRDDRTLLLLAEFLMDKIAMLVCDLISKSADHSVSATSVEQIVCGSHMRALLQVALDVASCADDAGVDPAKPNRNTSKNDSITSSLFPESSHFGLEQGTRSFGSFPFRRFLFQCRGFLYSLLETQKQQANLPHELEKLLFVLLSQIITRERGRVSTILRQKGGRRYRVQLQRLCLAKSAFLADVCVIYAQLLSQYPTRFVEGVLAPSQLIISIVDNRASHLETNSGTPNSLQYLMVQVCESLSWLWNFLRRNGSAGNDTADGNVDVSTATDRKIAKMLEIPVAAALVAFCGAGANSNDLHLCKLPSGDEACFGRTEVLDSGDSAFDCTNDSADETNEDPSEELVKRRASKRALLAMVHMSRCITSVFGSVKDINASSVFLRTMKGGSLMPIVVCRVLSRASDILFSLCDVDETPDKNAGGPDGTWAESYPNGTETIGAEIDSMLHKAYFCLYGFHLTFAHSHSKEYSSISGSREVMKNAIFVPESGVAAASLYKCIKRAYPSDEKRMPPKAALLCVTRALPEKQETRRSRAIKKYIFSGDINGNSAGGFNRAPTSLEPLDFPLWILNKNDDLTEDRETFRNGSTTSLSPVLLEHVWKSISDDLQRGPIPRFGSDSATPLSINKDGIETEDNHTQDRERMVRYELSLWNKIKGIVDYLGFDPDNTRGWFAAAQCLAAKSDHIRERIAKVEGGHGGTSFFPGPSAFLEKEMLPLPDLKERDDQEEAQSIHDWLPYIGNDLSVYAQFPWSSFSSLKTCSNAVAEQLRNAYRETNDSSESVTDIGVQSKTETAEQKVPQEAVLNQIGAPTPDHQAAEATFDQAASPLSEQVPAPKSDQATESAAKQAAESESKLEVMQRIDLKESHEGEAIGIYDEQRLEEPCLTDCDVWEDLESANPAEWQSGWGSLYVSALRTMAYRCYHVAYYLARQANCNDNDNEKENMDAGDLVAEVCETIGTAVYSELQGGWRYGYPIQRLPMRGVRYLAERALTFYAESLDLSSVEKSDEEELWGIHFLAGKVTIVDGF